MIKISSTKHFEAAANALELLHKLGLSHALPILTNFNEEFYDEWTLCGGGCEEMLSDCVCELDDGHRYDQYSDDSIYD